MAESANRFAWDIGNQFTHHTGDRGNFTFNATNDPSFPNLTAFLVNGVDDSLEFVSGDQGLGSANYSVVAESAAFGTQPDFIGHAIDSIVLFLSDLHVYSSGGGTWEFANYTWEVWGHPVFIAFAPPTEANGSYHYVSNYTNVSVQLASTGTNVKLNWDGVNRTMFGSGRQWYWNETDIANGNHTYQVWATDLASNIYRSETRLLVVAYHIWSAYKINPGTGPSVATDANGTVHVCYEDPNGYVHYATLTVNGWVVQLVGHGGNGYCLLVLDPSGGPHLLFGSLNYAFLNGTVWDIQHISVANVTRGAALTLNPLTSEPMVAYHDADPRERYLVFKARFPNGTWSTQIIDRQGDTGWMPSLAVNSTGVPRIAYMNSAGNVLYAYSRGSSWGILSVDNVTPLAGVGRISLAVDANNTPHIAYAGGGPRYGTVGYGGLRYASWNGSAWVRTTVMDGPAQSVSLAFDTHSRPAIAFSLVGTPPPWTGVLRELRYATWNGSWRFAVLSRAVNSSTVELSISPAGLPQIVATRWCCGNNTTQGPVEFYTVTVGIFAAFDVTPAIGNLTTVFRFDPTDSWDTLFPSSRLQVRWDFNGNGSWGLYGPLAPKTHQYLADGDYSVYAQLRDPSGTTALASREVVVDSQPPLTAATLSGTNGTAPWFRSMVSVGLTPRDNLTLVLSTWYSVDLAPWTEYASPFNVTGDGTHTVRFYSVDLAGNVEPTRSVTFGIDTMAPAPSLSLGGTRGSGVWYITSVQVTLTAADSGSGVVSRLLQTDGGPWQTYTQPVVLADGVHTVRGRAIDAAGNQGTTTTIQVSVDTVPPAVSAQVAGTLGASGWYSSPVVLSLTATDNLSGLATIWVNTNGGGWQSVASSTFTANFTSDGAYVVTYYAKDHAGNAAPQRIVTFRIDRQAPLVTAQLQGTAGTSGWFTSNVTVVLHASDNASGVAGYTYRVDGGAWDAYSVPFLIEDGIHIVEFTGTDVAGNVAPTQTLTVKVDTIPPAITNLRPAGLVTTGVVTLQWDARDIGSGLADFQLSVDGAAYSTVGNVTSVTVPLSDGDHTLWVRAIDQAGNSAAAETKLHVDTNVFSFYGPLAGLPLVALLLLVVFVLTILIILVWRRKEDRDERGAQAKEETKRERRP